MMAGLYLIFTFAILFIYNRQKSLGVSFMMLGLLLTLLMFWVHATSVLKINW
jgi:hypothetical protein